MNIGGEVLANMIVAGGTSVLWTVGIIAKQYVSKNGNGNGTGANGNVCKYHQELAIKMTEATTDLKWIKDEISKDNKNDLLHEILKELKNGKNNLH